MEVVNGITRMLRNKGLDGRWIILVDTGEGVEHSLSRYDEDLLLLLRAAYYGDRQFRDCVNKVSGERVAERLVLDLPIPNQGR
jgi:hypothetical protein